VIIVVGEALVDLVIAPSGAVDAALGGAPYNTARGAARLGADVEFVGGLSVDRFGSLLRERLGADGVETSHAVATDAPTTLAAAEIDDDGSAAYRFYFDGTSAPLVSAQAVEAAVAALQANDVLFTGGLGLVLEPMA
jgi:fructokinase